MKHAICYVSSVNGQIDLEEIESLLDLCKEKNMAKGIKGLLLFSEGNFFQILEGEKKIVLNLFEKIQKDPRHHGIIQIIGRNIDQGSYDGYQVDILKDTRKYQKEVPDQYFKVLQGIDPEVKKVLERMLSNFLATR